MSWARDFRGSEGLSFVGKAMIFHWIAAGGMGIVSYPVGCLPRLRRTPCVVALSGDRKERFFPKVDAPYENERRITVSSHTRSIRFCSGSRRQSASAYPELGSRSRGLRGWELVKLSLSTPVLSFATPVSYLADVVMCAFMRGPGTSDSETLNNFARTGRSSLI